jgi:hypothetical protein
MPKEDFMSQPRNSGVLGLMLTLSLLLGLAAEARAQKAVIVTGTRSGENPWWQYVKNKITQTGLYPGGVDRIDAAFSDPATASLLPYKLVVLLSSDYGLSSSDGVGNALGDYMNMVPGGAVLLFQPFTFQTGLLADPAVGGSFLAQYALTTQGNASVATATKRGNVTAGDPLVDGVTAFACGSSCTRVTGQVAKPGASVVAYWQDGTILAVRGKRRVDLNMLPADDTTITGSWKDAGGELITNSILYLSAPVIQSPRRADFPATGLGVTSKPTLITFRNISGATQTVTGIGIDGPGRSQFMFSSSKTPTPATPYTLGVNATFTAQVWFKPQVKGTYQAMLYADLVGQPRIQAPLNGITLGDLYVSLSPIDFGGIQSGTTAGPVTVRLKNTGASTINLDQPVIGDTTHFVLTPAVPDPKITMSPGSTYSFEVKFVPGMTAGDYSTEITITSTDPDSPLVIPVRALAGPPQAKVAYSSLLLPDVPTGSMGMPMDINITNEGNSDLQVTSITADKTDFVIPNAPSAMSPLTIAARDTKAFQLIFAPQQDGLRTGTLTIKTNEPAPMGMPSSDKLVALAGNGTKPKFHVSVTSLDFGAVEIGQPSPTKTVDLINDGDGDLTVKEVAIAMGMGAESFSVSTPDSPPFLLRAGTSVTATVSLKPKTAGMLTATLRVVTDLVTGGSATIDLKASASGAVGQLNPTMLSFGDAKVKQKVSKTVTLTNNGNKDLTILKSSLSPMVGVFAAMLPPNGTKIAAGKSVTITVDCIPAMVGMATGKLQIDTDDPGIPGGTSFTVPLSVNGVIANVMLTPTTLDFSGTPIYVGQQSGTQLLRVTNTGNVVIDNLMIMPSGPDAGDFSVVTGFKTKLMPTESTDIGVIFAPHVAKAMSAATLVLVADGVQVTMTVALKGSSMSPVIDAQPTDLKFEHTFVGEMSAQKFIILSNNGAQPLEIEIVPPTTEDFIIDVAAVKSTLAPGDTVKLPVLFTPKTPGDKSETISVRLKGTTNLVASVGIEGNATVKPMMMMESGCSATATRGRSASPLGLLALSLLALGLRRRRRLA